MGSILYCKAEYQSLKSFLLNQWYMKMRFFCLFWRALWDTGLVLVRDNVFISYFMYAPIDEINDNDFCVPK